MLAEMSKAEFGSSSESSVAPSPPPMVPVDFQSLLELNLAYQDLIQKLLDELETIFAENNELQQEAAEILVMQASESFYGVCMSKRNR